MQVLSWAVLGSLMGLVSTAVGARPSLSNEVPVQTPNSFTPTSTPAFAIRDLSWFVLGIWVVIFVIIGGLLAYSVMRFRRHPRQDSPRAPADLYGSSHSELAWTVMPVLIMVVILLVTARYLFGMRASNRCRTRCRSPSRPPVVVEIPLSSVECRRSQRTAPADERPEVFVIGDTASLEQYGKPLPAVAQVAIQHGRYVGRVIARRVTSQRPLTPFRYFDKGNMAVIGRNFAILESGRLRLSGFVAWLAWAAIHIAFLPLAGNRLMVVTQWMWSYVTKQRGARLILEPHGPAVTPPDVKPGA